jgi:hypothetical protein
MNLEDKEEDEVKRRIEVPPKTVTSLTQVQFWDSPLSITQMGIQVHIFSAFLRGLVKVGRNKRVHHGCSGQAQKAINPNVISSAFHSVMACCCGVSVRKREIYREACAC